MKNLFYLIYLLFINALFTITAGIVTDDLHQHPHHDCYNEPPKYVIFRRPVYNSKDEMVVNLTQIPNSVLANENLPIWIALDDKEMDNLVPATWVMRDMGPFFTYQDVENCAAAVYFSKRQQFDGNIGNHDVIYHVPYDPVGEKVMATFSNVFTTQIHHPEKLSGVSSDSTSMETIDETQAVKLRMEKWKYIESLLPYPDSVYIETLVMVNYDLVKTFRHNLAAMVSYILVTFNSVDMLYSKVDKPEIKINLAGIIIGNADNSYRAIEQYCYEQLEMPEEINVICAAERIRFILDGYQEMIPLDSYDLVVFLTELDLHILTLDDRKSFKKTPLNGFTSIPDYESYNGYKLSHEDVRVVLANNPADIYQSFSTIAHELAHAFNVHHDQGDLRNSDGECVAGLMRPSGDFCRNCLFFSDSSLKQIEHFFGSRDSCIYRNEPKSLYDPKSIPVLFWNEDEQCQCYGYNHSLNSQQQRSRGFWCYIKQLLKIGTKCGSQLKCVRKKNGRIYTEDTAYFMDGTPCHGKNKVCWNRKCETLAN